MMSEINGSNMTTEADLEGALVEAEKVEEIWWVRFAERWPDIFTSTAKSNDEKPT